MSRRIGAGRILAAAMLVSAAPAQSQSAGNDLLLQAEAQTLSGTCTGQSVRLEGNHNTVNLTGPCASLLVKGLANSVTLTIEGGGSIRVEGAQNHVQYTSSGAVPAVLTLGPDNVVTAGVTARRSSLEVPTPAAPPPVAQPPVVLAPPPVPASAPAAKPALPVVTATKAAGPLELSGDDEERLADCAGRDVVVTGSRSAYVIRGACHSLVLRGDLLTVQAVMQSGARIAVTGRGSVVSWAIPPRGHAPAAIVHGPGSKVQRADAIGGRLVK